MLVTSIFFFSHSSLSLKAFYEKFHLLSMLSAFLQFHIQKIAGGCVDL